MSKVIASIVLYKHNHNDLKPTLESLFASEFIDEIVLVDNDDSDWASTFSHPKISYLKSKGNFGFGYGHNLAIKKYANQSKYFLICNPDIVFDVYEFDKLIQFAETRTQGLFLPKIVYENGENQYGARLLPLPLNLFTRRFSAILAHKLDQKYLLKALPLDQPSFVPYLSGCFMLFRSECLIALKGFDERFFMYMEDIDISRRCAEKYGNVYYPLAHIVHQHEQASYKSKQLLQAHLKSAIQYFNKWGWLHDKNREQLNFKCLNQFY